MSRIVARWHGLQRRLRIAHRQVRGDFGAFVLMYHRVAEVRRDPWRLVVSPERFDQQLAMLRRDAAVLSLADFHKAAVAGRLPRNAVTITFDDGYADNLHVAKPILDAHGLPATVFLATGVAGHGGSFWWDTLESLLLGAHPLPRTLLHGLTDPRDLTAEEAAARDPRADDGWCAEGGPADARQQLFLQLWRALAALDGATRSTVLGQLDATIGRAGVHEHTPRALTAHETGSLSRDGRVTLGAHTVSHPMLPALSDAEQRDEITRSREDVARLSGVAPTAFSFPHGRFTARTLQLAVDAGFRIVCATSVPGRPLELSAATLDAPAGTSVHPLPRATVLDWDASALRRQLHAGFDG